MTLTGKTLSGRGVLVWLIGFFGLIIATNTVFVTMAVKTFRGEDEQKPYLQGIEYNHTLAERAEQKRLGWNASVTAQRLPGGLVQVETRVAGRDGAVERALALTGEMRHPSDENRDQPLTFHEVAPGLYRAQLRGVAPGLWDIRIASTGRTPFTAERRTWVP